MRDRLPKRPSYQWYPGDARRDTALASLPLIVRGFWRELLDLMHDGEPYGYLTAGGLPLEPDDLARIVGEKASDVGLWLEMLERRNVFSRNDKGVIFSRRQVRDEEVRLHRAIGGDNAPQPNKGGGKGGGKGIKSAPLDPPFDPPPASAFASAFASASSSTKERTPASPEPPCVEPVENSEGEAPMGEWTAAQELAPFAVVCALVKSVLNEASSGKLKMNLRMVSSEDTDAGAVYDANGLEADLADIIKERCAKARLGYNTELVRKALDAVRGGMKRTG